MINIIIIILTSHKAKTVSWNTFKLKLYSLATDTHEVIGSDRWMDVWQADGHMHGRQMDICMAGRQTDRQMHGWLETCSWVYYPSILLIKGQGIKPAA